ncbi:MAG: hypothetical protein KDC39_09420 [Actinobacteria bacterium]|nr:hypothetical protein [Actinomycetota bacterium]
MARRADVRRIGARLPQVWSGLLLFRPKDGKVLSATGNPGDLGSVIVYRRAGGTFTTTVMESAPKHYVRYSGKFSGVVPRMAFTRGAVESDFEVKASSSSDTTYIRAVVDYEAPMWPTALALLFALGSLIGMNTAAAGLLWGIPVALFVALGIGLQYVPRQLAYRLVTKPVLDRLEAQAEDNDYRSAITWRPERVNVTDALDLRTRDGSSPHTAADLTGSQPRIEGPGTLPA